MTFAIDARRLTAVICLFLAQYLVLPEAGAVVVKNLFDVEFPVPDQSSQIRAAVFTKGLEEVLIRTGQNKTLLAPLTADYFLVLPLGPQSIATRAACNPMAISGTAP